MIKGLKTKEKIWDSYDFMKLSEMEQKTLIGAKVDTEWFGVGTATEIKNGRIMVKAIIKCKNGKHRKQIYLTDAFTTGDLGNVYNQKGEYLGNIGNDYFKSFCNC